MQMHVHRALRLIMALSDDIRDLERRKFAEDSSSNTAVRVLVSSGSVLNNYTSEFKAGSTGSGSDGATNRVFTLANTSLTSAMRVHIGQNGLAQTLVPTTGFTVSHQATGTLVTIKVAVYDADTLWFEYY